MGGCASKDDVLAAASGAEEKASSAAAPAEELSVAAAAAAATTAAEEEEEEAEEEEEEAYNEALVFIKPHAANDKVKALVEDFFAEKHIEILAEGELMGPQIDKGGIIDSHYAHIAKIARGVPPSAIQVSAEKTELFETTFGETWEAALETGRLLNLKAFEEEFPDLGDEAINATWMTAPTEKLAPGTYVGYFADQDRYVMNAFYGTMRAVYTSPTSRVVYFTVRFPESKLSWKEFRSEVIGATDPTAAHKGSLRAKILDEYEALGLEAPPNLGQNGVHASAGPFEGLRERMVWLGSTVEKDLFGKALLSAGVPRDTIDLWLSNEVVTINGETDHAFDLLEDLDASASIELALANHA